MEFEKKIEELCELFGRQDDSFRQEATILISHRARVEALAQFVGNMPDGAEELWKELLRQ